MARFLIDESLPPQLAEALRLAGHEAVHVQERGLSGLDDDAIYEAANEGGFIVVSTDLDFADERRFLGNVGLVVFRFRHGLSRDEIVRRCFDQLRRFAEDVEGFGNNVMIIGPTRARMRRRSP